MSTTSTTYHQSGYTILPALLSAPTLRALADGSRTLAPFGTSFASAMQPHRAAPAFLDALRLPPILTAVRSILGSAIAGLQSQLHYGPPGWPGYPPHQDAYYTQAAPDAFLSVWIPLLDVAIEHGPLVVYPGTHRLPILPVSDVQADGSPIRQAVAVDPAWPRQVCTMQAGDVLLLHGHTVHESLPNQSWRLRPAVLLTYLRQGATYRPGREAKREPVAVD